MAVTSEQITTLFLFGSKKVPSDLTSDAIIDHPVGVLAEQDMQDHMTNGAGRSAYSAWSEKR